MAADSQTTDTEQAEKSRKPIAEIILGGLGAIGTALLTAVKINKNKIIAGQEANPAFNEFFKAHAKKLAGLTSQKDRVVQAVEFGIEAEKKFPEVGKYNGKDKAIVAGAAIAGGLAIAGATHVIKKILSDKKPAETESKVDKLEQEREFAAANDAAAASQSLRW